MGTGDSEHCARHTSYCRTFIPQGEQGPDGPAGKEVQEGQCLLGYPRDSPAATLLSVSAGPPRKAWHCRTCWPEGESCQSSPMVPPAPHHTRGAMVKLCLSVSPQGEAGSPGMRGYPGEKGRAGAPGGPGKSGSMGPIGLRGPAGERGPPGSPGPAGSPGLPGPPGMMVSGGQPGAGAWLGGAEPGLRGHVFPVSPPG